MGSELIKFKEASVTLDNFSLSIEDMSLTQGVYWVKGANGSGKSTFLRILLGLQPLDTGHLASNYQDKAGYLPQTYRDSLFSWISAHKNLSLVNSDIEACAKWLSLLGFNMSDLEKRVHQLSGGQVQRLALVRECCLWPNLLVLDEPFSSLDIQTSPVAGELIAESARQNNTAVIFTTHSDLPPSIEALKPTEIMIYRLSDTTTMVEMV